MSESIIHHLSALGAAPISDANQCGDSVRYEPEFEQLEAEIAKLESLKGEAVDWKTVANLSSDILQRKSKDLLVGVYLCQALLQTEGYKGLAVGLQIINDMSTHYWEPMHPSIKRLRGRKAAMEWLSDKASQYIGSHTPSTKDNDAIIQAAQVGRELDGFLAEKMGNDAPTMSDMIRPLKQFSEAIKQQLAKAAKIAPIQPSNDTQTSSAASKEATLADGVQAIQSTGNAAPPTSAQKNTDFDITQANIESDADARKILRQLQDGMRKVSGFYSKTKIADPKAYRLSRTASWMTIDQVPPNKEGVTQIPPPPADRRKHISSLYEQSQFSQIVTEAEQLISRSVFWLDGQRIVANAMKALGSEFSSARDVVIQELRNFLGRVPGIAELKFSDGTPFADETTKIWIDTEVVTKQDSKNSAVSQKNVQTNTPWKDALIEAKSMVASGELNKAVRKFHEGIEKSSGHREKFYWRTGLSELLIQSGNINVATQMLEEMIDRIELKQLEDWESDLVVPVYRHLYEAYQKSVAKKKNDTSIVTKMENVYSKLCWLDPTTAITVKGE